MANLLVVSKYSDQNFESADYTFVYHQITGLKRFFDQIYVIAPTPYFPRWLRPVGRVWETLRLRMAKRDYAYDNVSVFFAPFAPWAGRLPSGDRVRAVWPAVQRTLRKHDLAFDLVHSHMTLGFGWHGLQVARAAGVPAVHTIHDNHDGLMPALRAQRWDAIETLRESDALIRVSPADVEEIREISGTERPIHYIPNGFDASQVSALPREELRAELGLPNDRKIFVSVARWVERKDPLILLEGLHRMTCEAGKRPLLCLLGEDVSDGRIERRIRELGLENDVQVRGQRPPEEVLQTMRAGDAVVLYSRSEGNPTVMFEALGCGRPYIGSDVGGVSAVLTDERLGLCGPPNDADSLARLMERAASTAWDEAFIREHARQYTWENVAQRIHSEVFEPLLHSGR